MKILDPKMREPVPTLTGPLPARIVPCAAPPPDAADEDFADGSVEMNADGSQLRVALALQAAQPLVADRTVYVHSATGSDANDGSQAAPFQTLMRAWTERRRYGVLRARFTIQLLGAGPYTVSQEMSGSICDGPDGYFVLAGDMNTETTHYEGTFTGDFSGITINTSVGLGVDTHKNRFVRITSGVYTGFEFMILEHTDAQVLAVNRRFRGVVGTAITAGTTFKIFTPGTVINATQTHVFSQCFGGSLTTSNAETSPRHVMHHVLGTGSPFNIKASIFAVFSCKFSGIFAATDRSTINTFLIDAVRVLGSGAVPNLNVYRSSGVVGSGISFNRFAYVYGSMSSETTFTVDQSSLVEHTGGRIVGTTSITHSLLSITSLGSTETGNRFDGTVTLTQRAMVRVLQSGSLFRHAVVVGSCYRVTQFAQLLFDNLAAGLVGGTTDPAGVGVDVSGGGQCLFRVPPTLTGGTAGKDLKTTNNGGVANSVLSAAGTAAGVAADALLGEVIARVA